MSASQQSSAATDGLSVERVGLALILSGIFTLAAFPILNTDFWWHLRVGRLIVEEGRVPVRDSLSFTAAGMPWLDHEWLAEVTFYLLHEAFGIRGVALLVAALMTFTFYLLYRRMAMRGVSPVAAQITLFPAFIATIGSVFLRIQPFTLLMLSAFLLVLENFSASRRRGLLALLPLLMLIWTNLHGGFAVGLAVIAIAIAAQQLERWRGDRQRTDLPALWVAFVATLLAAAVNPNGLRHLAYPFRFLKANYFTRHINESQRPGFDDPVSIVFFLMLAAAVACAFLSRKRISWFDGLLSAAFTILALSQLRHISVWVVAVSPIAAGFLSAAFFARAEGNEIDARRVPATVRWALLVSAPLAALLMAAIITAEPEIQALEQRRYPAKAAEFLRSHRVGTDVFAEYRWGGYVLWRLNPPCRTFIDGRADTLFPDDTLRRYLAIHSASPGWKEDLDRSGADVALLAPSTPLTRALAGDPSWRRIYADDVAVAFARR